jgi:sulfur-oxidizing protein SoxX
MTEKLMKPVSLLTGLLIISCAVTPEIPKPPAKAGKEIAFSRDKGNCLACHQIEDGEFPGNIGPPLKALSSRFKDKQRLREQIWDATQFNPQTSMPPFGKNKILSAKEIDLLVDYLWGLK